MRFRLIIGTGESGGKKRAKRENQQYGCQVATKPRGKGAIVITP
jgi:hypothetical protein